VPTEVTEAPTTDTPLTSKGKKTGQKDPKPPEMSALDAAAKVLADADTPMNCQEMMSRAHAKVRTETYSILL
jgi:hypothetical protein